MFFFFFDFQAFEIIKKCFDHYLKTNFSIKGYCDVSELFSDGVSKREIKDSLSIDSDEVVTLYKHKYPESKEDLYIVSELYANKMNHGTVDIQESFAILFWCFKIFKKNRPFEKYKDEIMQELMAFISDEHSLSNYGYFNSIIYDSEKTTCYFIDSLSGFLNMLQDYSGEELLYFRGHSKTSYQLKPSILRTERLKENESLIYQELLISCPDDFKNFRYHIDYLVKMQHYGLPTRLLDITRNPLVALYFACCNNKNDIGEVILFAPQKKQIKYPNSDTISMLASLPLFSYEDQRTLIDVLAVPQKDSAIIDRFIHEIQIEKPGFINRINCSDLESCFVVLTKKDNNRIIKQDGAFIICGINDNPESMINKNLTLNSKNKKVLVFISNKAKILKELDLLSINKSTLFPEIDNVADYIKEKYCN